MRKLRLVILALVVACTSGVAVSAQQTGTPALSCPAGYALTATFTHPYLVQAGYGVPSSMSHDYAFPEPTSTVLTVWSMVGHPDEGCALGEGNDGGQGGCDDISQANEEFYIDVDGGNVAFVSDHGTDQWKFFGEVNAGTLAAGNHTFLFRHSNVSANNTPESVTYLVGLCTSAAPTPPPPPPPPTGDQGCTPGYWKQPHHADSWPIGNGDFDDAFGLGGNPTGNTTLLAALGANGGGVNALKRHAAAALLNAYSSGVSYGLTVDQVKGIVQQAFASGSYEGAKNTLESYNERVCPLN